MAYDSLLNSAFKLIIFVHLWVTENCNFKKSAEWLCMSLIID